MPTLRSWHGTQNVGEMHELVNNSGCGMHTDQAAAFVEWNAKGKDGRLIRNVTCLGSCLLDNNYFPGSSKSPQRSHSDQQQKTGSQCFEKQGPVDFNHQMGTVPRRQCHAKLGHAC